FCFSTLHFCHPERRSLSYGRDLVPQFLSRQRDPRHPERRSLPANGKDLLFRGAGQNLPATGGLLSRESSRLFRCANQSPGHPERSEGSAFHHPLEFLERFSDPAIL